MPGAAAVEVADPHLGRCEQRGVDLVEVEAGGAEDVGERGAVVARIARRQLLRERARRRITAAHAQVHAAAVQDGVVGAAHRLHAVGAGRGQRRGGCAFDDVMQREAEFVGLVQRDLEHPRDHLRRARKAGGGREDQRQRLRCQAAVAQQLVDHDLRRHAVDFEHQHTGIGVVAVAEFGEQLLLAGQRAGRAGAEREELLAARFFFGGGEAPAGVLAAQTGQHRLRTADLDPRRPALQAAGAQRHAAQATHADLGHPQAGCDAAAAADAGVDEAHAARIDAHAHVERISLGAQLPHERRSERVHAQGLCGKGWRRRLRHGLRQSR